MKNNQKASAHAHPTTADFIRTGMILFVITAIEFSIVYLKGMRSTIVTLLAALSIIKFYLVATVFMHLKFDPRFLGWIFSIGVVLGSLILIALKYVNLA